MIVFEDQVQKDILLKYLWQHEKICWILLYVVILNNGKLQ